MSKHNFIHLTFQNIKNRKRQNIIAILLILLTTLVLFLGSTFLYGISNYRNVILKESLFSRTNIISIDPNEEVVLVAELEQLLENDIIENYQSQNFSSLVQLEDIDYVVESYNNGLDGDIVYGSGIKRNDVNKVVLPLYMNGSVGGDYQNKIVAPDIFFIDSKSLVGTILTLKITIIDPDRVENEHYFKDYEVIGVYDNVKNYMGLNTMLLSYDDMVEINKRQGNYNDSVTKKYYEYTVSSSNEAAKVLSILRNKFENIYSYEKRSYKPLDDFILLAKFILSFNVFVLSLLTISYYGIMIDKNFQLRIREFGMMKTLGFRMSLIRKMMHIENLSVVVFAVLLSSVFYSILIHVIRGLLYTRTTVYFHLINLTYKTNIVIVTFLVLLVISILVTRKYIIRNNINDAIELIKE